jgi:drug/metabolite transporter (DMT)-like permease
MSTVSGVDAEAVHLRQLRVRMWGTVAILVVALVLVALTGHWKSAYWLAVAAALIGALFLSLGEAARSRIQAGTSAAEAASPDS